MRVLVYGASTNPDRYAYMATELLAKHGHELVLIGHKAGTILGHAILTDNPLIDDVDTVTLYVGLKNQGDLLTYMRAIMPRRVIFNPGTENPALANELQKIGILTEEACTLVLLHTGQF